MLLVAVPIVSIVAAAFTLPVSVTLPLAVVLVLVPLALDRFVFVYPTLLVMPGLGPVAERNSIGTMWALDEARDPHELTLCLAFWNRESARDAFEMLRAWNYGRYVDKEENIRFSVVAEGKFKYTLLVYAGDRLHSHQYAAENVLEAYGPKAVPEVMSARQYIYNCVDYAEDELKRRLVESLRYRPHVYINTTYVTGEGAAVYSKRGIRLERFSFLDRADVDPDTLEGKLTWKNHREEVPEEVMHTLKESGALDTRRILGAPGSHV